MQLGAAGAGRAPAPHGAQAFHEHECADNAEEGHIGQFDDEIDLADRPQDGEQPNAKARAQESADQQDGSHLEVDVAAPPMGEHAGDRRGDDLIGLGADGDRRRHADEDQRGRHEEAAAHAEEAGQEPDETAQPEQQKGVERYLGDREVDLHLAF